MKIIIAGCGSMARRRIRHVLDATDAGIYVHDIRPDRMAEVKDLFPAVVCLQSSDEMAALTADAIFVCVPPAAHEFYIEFALANGVAFMCEQPISHRLENLGAIRERVAARNLICHVSNNQRYSPRVATLRNILADGSMGGVLTGLVELGEWLPLWHPYEPYQDYYPSWRGMGGGLDAVCDLDWLRDLFGEPVRMNAMCSRKSDLEIDTYDVVQFLVDFGEGKPQIAMHLDMLQQPIARQSRIVCENGVVVHNHPDQFHRVFRAATGLWEEVPFDIDLSLFPSMPGKNQSFAEPMYLGDTLEFLRRLRESDTSLDSLDNGIRNISLVFPHVFGDRSDG
jgi:predicted dehydrogenase